MRTFGAQTSMRGFTNCEYFWLSQNQNGWVRFLIEGACAPPCQLVYSTEMSLPVGFCLTIYFAQSVSSKLLRESLQPLCSQPLTDRSCLKVLQQSKTPTLITWAVWGCNRIGVEEAVMRAKSHFESIGLKLHKLDVRNAAATTLGINLDLTNFATENTPKRLGQCYHSISHALHQRTHLGLVYRDLLSIFHGVMPSLSNVMKIQLRSGKVSKKSLPHSEVLMIFTVGSWVAPWSPMVYACDFLSRWVSCAKLNLGRVRCA